VCICDLPTGRYRQRVRTGLRPASRRSLPFNPQAMDRSLPAPSGIPEPGLTLPQRSFLQGAPATQRIFLVDILPRIQDALPAWLQAEVKRQVARVVKQDGVWGPGLTGSTEPTAEAVSPPPEGRIDQGTETAGA
jgi:hypothetical protein